MAMMMDVRPQAGEGIVWDKFSANLPSDVVCYHNRVLANRESDFIVVIPDRGIFVIEVKSWLPDNVYVNDVCEIFLNNETKPTRNPSKQARKYRFHVLDFFNDKKSINPLVFSMVCYPNMSKDDYQRCKLDYISEETSTLFREDLDNPQLLFDKFNQLYVDMYNQSMDKLDEKTMGIVRATFEPNYNEVIIPPQKPIALYSEVLACALIPDAKKIVDDYFSGIKMIIFTSDYDGIQSLLSELSSKFDALGLTVSGNNISYSIGKKNSFELINNEFSIFNFSIYLTNSFEHDFHIEDGNYKEYFGDMVKLEQSTNFNFEQFRVEHAELKNILVKAGAGTGKTYSMVSRVAFLYHVDNFELGRISDGIVMLTFTNEAADNMRKRLKKHFMNYYVLTNNTRYLDVIADIEIMCISTIHKFANTIIRDAAISIGLGHQFAITDSEVGRKQAYLECYGRFISDRMNEDSSFVRSLPMKSYEIIEELMKVVDSLYQKGIDVKSINRNQLGRSIISIPSFNDMIINVAQRAELLVEEQCLSRNEMQLKQMMIYCLDAIRSSSFKTTNHTYKYLFVDEFQDTDDMQIDIFSELNERVDFKLFIVGDLKQSIYRFRGATMDAFNRIKILTDVDKWSEEYSLRHNYRTDNRLLSRFNCVFDSISEDKGKPGLIPYGESASLYSRIMNRDIEESDLYAYKTIDSNDEKLRFDALFSIVEQQQRTILAKYDFKSLPEERRSIAILVRTNREVKAVVKAGRERNIYVETRGGGDLYQSFPANDLSALLSALTHPNDLNYLFALIESNYVNTDFAIQNIVGCSIEDKRKAIFSCLDQYFGELVNLSWKDIVSLSNKKPILVVLKQLYEATMPWKRFKNSSKQIDYQNNYDLIVELVLRKFKVESLTLGMMDDYLCNCIISGQDVEPRTTDADDSGVHIICMTVHKSKGLEFEYVDLPYTDRRMDSTVTKATNAVQVNGMIGYAVKINGNFESSEFYDDNEENIQTEKEDARILYVAMTRAISSLTWISNNEDGITWNRIMQEGLRDEY